MILCRHKGQVNPYKPMENEVFASARFISFLHENLSNMDRLAAKQVLQACLKAFEFPEELEQEQLPKLLQKMNVEIAPHDSYWRDFARLVDKAYPDGNLPKSIHQLRYLLSYQQADWVRRHYGQEKSDWLAMVDYLSTRPRWIYQLRQSARLHNKQHFRREKISQNLPINIKVLIRFHSEFILDENGKFALILDENPTQNGQINGASFNYARANNRRHYQLDIQPVGPHDPRFRKKILRSKAGSYLSPTRIYWFQGRKSKLGWERSYFNRYGSFAQNGTSRAGEVTRLRQQFSRDIRLRLCQKIKSWYNKK